MCASVRLRAVFVNFEMRKEKATQENCVYQYIKRMKKKK